MVFDVSPFGRAAADPTSAFISPAMLLHKRMRNGSKRAPVRRLVCARDSPSHQDRAKESAERSNTHD
jgi:hypothetical protein